MNRLILLLLSLVATLVCGLNASAEIQYGYTVDFNTPIQTRNHDFKVAPNWKHIVHKFNDGYSDYYMSYGYNETGGRSGGTLLAYEQRAGDNYDNEETYDLLVTPVVSGEISLWVKLHSNSGYLEFYSLNETQTGRDERLARFSASSTSEPRLSESSWVQVKINVLDAQNIGIRASRAYIDDFMADEAVIELEKSIMVESAVPSNTTGTIYWDQLADGSVEVKYTVTVTNNGQTPLTIGEKNYSVSIINGKTSQTYVTTPVPQALEIGETSEPFDVIANIPADQVTTIWPNTYSSVAMNLRENLQGSITLRAISNYKPYAVKYIFRKHGSTQTSSINTPIDYGIVSESITKKFDICNDGIAEMKVSSLSAPDGFTHNFPAEGISLSKGESFTIDLTLDAATTGNHSGDLTIKYIDEKGDEKTYTIALKGIVILPGTWAVNFNNNTGNGSLPKYPQGSIAEAGIKGDYTVYDEGMYDMYLTSWTSSDYASSRNKFITPLLHAEAGDKVSFDAATTSTSSSTYFLKAYLSSDRKNWGEPIITLASDDLTTTLSKHEIQIPEAGDYYIGFAIYGTMLDNIIGLQPVEVAHDVYFTEFNQTNETQTGISISPSVKIIPLTDEAAESYTVSYWFDGQAVATAPSIALTASAKDTKTFTVNYTPDTETTKTVDTYFSFTFGDQEFKSEVKQITVTCQPDFVFFDKGTYGGGSYKPNSRVNAIDFGISNDPGITKEFEIFNWGTAPLTVKSITIADGFSVNVSSATVAPKERQEVIITFSTETAGDYNGKLTIVYVDENGLDQTYELDLKGKMLDPSKWYASFDNGTTDGLWPAGSIHERDVSITNTGGYSDPICMIESSTSESSNNPKNLFITPRLNATAGETFSFDAEIYSSTWTEGKVKIYTSSTREDLLDESKCILLGTFSGDSEEEGHKMTTDLQTFSVLIPEAGEQYIGIRIYRRARVDNLYGLTPVDNPVDLIVNSANIPTEAMQNVVSTATIQLLNVGTRDANPEDLDITVYVDGIPSKGTVKETIPAVNTLDATPTDISASFRSSVIGEHPVYMTLSAGSFSYTTPVVNVNFIAEQAAAEKTVGTPDGTATSSPISSNYYNSESLALYTPELLDLQDGAKISSITWKGYSVSYTSDLSVYYMLTDDTTLTKPGETASYDTIDMERILSAPAYNWEAVGSESAYADIIKIDLTEPIIYESGKSLLILVRSISNSYKYGINIEKGKETELCFYHRNDGTKGVFTSEWAADALPVIHLGLIAEPSEVSGLVTAAGEPVAGATIKLTSNDGDGIGYTTTTGADGKYSLQVIQNSRAYDLEVTTTDGGYAKYINGRIFPENEIFDIALARIQTLNDETIAVEVGDDNIIIWETVFPEGFNAIVLPFDLDATETVNIFGEDAIIHEFAGDTGEGAVSAKFARRILPGLEAGVPYLIYLENPSAKGKLFDKKTVAEATTVNGIQLAFTGTLAPITLNAGMFLLNDYNYTGVTKAPARVKGQLAPFRAFLRGIGPNVNTVTFTTDSDLPVITGVDSISGDDADETIYDLNGIEVKNPAPGIYIRGGKKIIIK